VAHRSDLNYVLGEMVAELNIATPYIEGGDWQKPPRPGLPCRGRVRARPGCGPLPDREDHAGPKREERYRAPLTEVGVDARQGDYVRRSTASTFRPTTTRTAC